MKASHSAVAINVGHLFGFIARLKAIPVHTLIYPVIIKNNNEDIKLKRVSIKQVNDKTITNPKQVKISRKLTIPSPMRIYHYKQNPSDIMALLLLFILGLGDGYVESILMGRKHDGNHSM